MTSYYRVGTAKLATLSFCTLGFYSVYWFYRQWQAEGEEHDESYSAPLCAFFSVLTAYSLFSRIHAALSLDGDCPRFSPGLYAVAYFVLVTAWRLPDPYGLIGLLWFLPIVHIQQAINTNVRKHDPTASLNETWEWWALFLACVGGTFMLVGVVGTLFPALPE